MALVKCPECGTSVSEFAASCPACGFSVAQEIKKAPLKENLKTARDERDRYLLELAELNSKLNSLRHKKILILEARKRELIDEKNRGTGVTKPANFLYVIGGVLLFGLAIFELVALIGDMPLLALIGSAGAGLIGYGMIHTYLDDKNNKSKFAPISAEILKKIETELSEIDKKLPNLQKEEKRLEDEIIPARKKLEKAENKVRKIEEAINSIGNNISHSSPVPLDNKPRCPTCRSDNIERITELERYVDSTGFGTLAGGGLNSPSLGKTFKCNKCGYRW